MTTTKNLFEVEKMAFDATRPYAVVATFRSFNRVLGRYEDEAKARRRTRDMIRREELATYRSGRSL